MRGDSGPPLAPTKSGAVGRQIVRAERHVFGDQALHLRQHRHHALLAAFACHGDGVALCRVPASARVKPNASEMRRPAAVEQRQHRGVARKYPGSAPRRRAGRHRRCACAAVTGSGFGSVLRDLRARARRQARRRGPCRCARDSARRPRSRRACASASGCRCLRRGAAMKARTSRASSAARCLQAKAGRRGARSGNRGTARRRADRLPRLGRHAPLGAQMGEPVRELRRHIRGGEGDGSASMAPLALDTGRHISPRFLHPSLSAGIGTDCRMAQAHRRCSGAGRARPGLFVPGAGGAALAPGDIVAVPLGARDAIGVVWADNPSPIRGLAQPAQGRRAKSSTCRRSSAELRSFVDWVANYTLSPRGMVLRMACAWASISAPSASASACGLPARRRSA